MATKICLVLTEETLEKDMELVRQYAGYYDLVELRADLLFSNETFYIRKFPALAQVPTILTCRRVSDGGKFKDGEGARLTLLAKGLSFLENDKIKNFSYVDFESDFPATSLEEAARAFNIKIIRSFHNLKMPVPNIQKQFAEIARSDGDILKIAAALPSLQDFASFILQRKDYGHKYILSGLGRYGYLSRIFAQRLGSEIVYTFPKKYIERNKLQSELIDPITLVDKFGFRRAGDSPKMFAVVGEDVRKSRSPELHNAFFAEKNFSACYVPISVDNFESFFSFAKKVNLQGASITAPFKRNAFQAATQIYGMTHKLKALNTLINRNGNWVGYNTDVSGFKKALLEFLGDEKTENLSFAVLGAGGVAEAVCEALSELFSEQGIDKKNFAAMVCIFNRTGSKAYTLAHSFGFSDSILSATDKIAERLKKFSSVIINCTTLGSVKYPDKDPLKFYEFTGDEKVFDMIYEPARTKLLKHAKKSGCKICNGYRMLELQAIEQSKLFLGEVE